MDKRLTEDEWREVFRLRCKSKRGDTLSQQELARVTRAYHEDPVRYAAEDDDVFNATVPFGSVARRGSP